MFYEYCPPRWVWNHPEVSVVLSGMNEEEHIEENIRIANEAHPESLSENELQRIDSVKKKYKELMKVGCTGCNYCMPCSQGVDIPGNFALLNNRSIETSRIMRFRLGRRYSKFVNSSEKVDKNRPNGNASICNDCGECVSSCPQHIEIPMELKKAHAILGKGKKTSEYYR